MKRKNLMYLTVLCVLTFAVTGCGAVNESDTVTEESVTVEMTKSTESESATETSVYVPEESLAEEPETEATEAVTEEMTAEALETEESEVTESVVNTENPATTAPAETVTTEMSPLTETPYTYTDLNKTMYAKSTVNVRSLPSTDGTQLGSLNKNQSVTVTGQCNETGWYRIVFDNAEAYVSNNFLKELQETAEAVNNVNNPGNADIAAGAVNNADTGDVLPTSTNTTSVSVESGLRKDVALAIWDYVNAERTAAGLNALTWNEDTYNFACKRAQEIITDFSHNGCGDYGENILYNWTTDAYELHMQWYNSPGHHTNYMRDGYEYGACAVYVAENGQVYAVENFQTTHKPRYHDYLANCPTWTASNGVIVRIKDNGNTTVSGKDNPGKTDEELDDALDEYYGIGRWASSSEQSTPSSSPLTETVTSEPEQTEEPAYQLPVETQPESWTASNGVTVYVQNGNAYTRGDDGYSDDEHYKAWQEYTQCH